MRRLLVLAAGLMSALVWSPAGRATEIAGPFAKPPAGAVLGIPADPFVGNNRVMSPTVNAFKGIPYARPPIGDLRWRPPQPLPDRELVFTADRYGPICTQIYNPQDAGVGPLPMSEDCLTLNVFTPVARGPHPVMVWIHGGGFVNGSGTAALYDGTALARQGVVVVTLNYRLGRFGFFAHPALTKEAAGGPVANYGLMDQIAALKWVQRNIAAFGGDPGNVTIFGESAGGISVNRLMVTPQAAGLFHKAISQSGLGSEQPYPLGRPDIDGPPSAEAAGATFAARLGVSPDDPNAARALRALSAEKIIALGAPGFGDGAGPIRDGDLVTGRVDALFAAGKQAQVPYLLGSNALEFPWMTATRPGPVASFIRWPPETMARLKAAYPTEAAYEANLVSDAMFTEPARYLARTHAAAGQPTWLYRFSVLTEPNPPGLTATPHAQERQYVFDTLATSSWPTNANDAAQAATVSAYWVAFAKTGDPNGGGRVVWPRYRADGGQLLDFTNAGPHTEAPWPSAGLDALAKVQAPARK